MRHRGRHAMTFLALALAGSLTLAGCGAAPDPADSGSGDTVRLLLPAKTTAFADVLVADGAGIFAKHAIDIEILPEVTNSTAQVQATVGGDADVTGTTYTTVFGAVAARQDIVLFAPGANTQNSVVVAARDWIDEQAAKGITVDSPPEEKVKALEGAVMGVAARGTATEILYRKLFDHYGVRYGESTFVGLGNPRALDAGLRAKQVDTIYTGMPTGLLPGVEGYGDIWLGPEDYPALEPWRVGTIGYVTSRAWIEQHGDTAERYLAAINEARALIRTDPRAAVDAYLKVAPDFDPDLTLDAFTIIASNYEGDAVMTTDMFERNAEIYNETADQPSTLSYQDGVWTGVRQ